MSRRAKQYIVQGPAMHDYGFSGAREDVVQKRLFVYARSLLPGHVQAAFTNHAQITQRMPSFNVEDTELYRTTIKNMQGAENVADMLRTFTMIDMIHASMDSIEQQLAILANSSNIDRDDMRLTQMFTNLYGFRIVIVEDDNTAFGPNQPDDIRIPAQNRAIAKLFDYLVQPESRRYNRAPTTHFLGRVHNKFHRDGIARSRAVFEAIAGAAAPNLDPRAGAYTITVAAAGLTELRNNIMYMPKGAIGFAVNVPLLALMNVLLQSKSHTPNGNFGINSDPALPFGGQNQANFYAPGGAHGQAFMLPYTPLFASDNIGNGGSFGVAVDTYIAGGYRMLMQQYIPFRVFSPDMRYALIMLDEDKVLAKVDVNWRNGHQGNVPDGLVPASIAQVSAATNNLSRSRIGRYRTSAAHPDIEHNIRRPQEDGIALAAGTELFFKNVLTRLPIPASERAKIVPEAVAAVLSIGDARSLETALIYLRVQELAARIDSLGNTSLMSGLAGNDAARLASEMDEALGVCNGGATQWWTADPYQPGSNAQPVPANHPGARFQACSTVRAQLPFAYQKLMAQQQSILPRSAMDSAIYGGGGVGPAAVPVYYPLNAPQAAAQRRRRRPTKRKASQRTASKGKK